MGIKLKEENTNGSSLHNTLAAGTTVKGNISTEADLRLDGIIEGDIQCNGKLIVGPKGKVTGNIIAANAEILGTVEGAVQTEGRLILKATAVIQGDIATQTLEIEPNARFNGACRMASTGETRP